MEFTLVRTTEELIALQEEWDALLSESASHVPFLRSDYLRVWWKTLGGGEWPQGELAVALARRDGRLVGIAPLFFTRNRDGQPALMLLGSVEISDYLDFIVREQDTAEFISGLLAFLPTAGLPDWRALDLYNILEDSPSLPALEGAARELGWSYRQERLQHSPHIPLPGDWETYLAGIDKKQRHEIRRKLRRIEESATPSRWYIVEDGADLEKEVDAFLALMVQDEEKQAFLTGEMRATFHEIARCAFDRDCLQLAFLEIDGEKAAAYLSFDYLERIWVYNSGISRRFTEYSPGWVLVSYLVRWANEHKRLEFDFLRGDEEYKYRFGAVDRFVVRARVERK